MSIFLELSRRAEVAEWQTRQVQDLVRANLVWVQLPPSAPGFDRSHAVSVVGFCASASDFREESRR